MATVLDLQSHSFASMKCSCTFKRLKMERNSFKEYSVLAMISKEEQQPMKCCLDDLMWTDSGTKVDGHNFGKTIILKSFYHVHFMWILNRYSKYRTLAVFTWTFKECWQWNSTCATVILLDLQAQEVDLDFALFTSVAGLLSTFFRYFILVPKILPQNKILDILLHFGGPI